MGLGAGVFLIVLGLIFLLDVIPNIPAVADWTLGMILLLAGIASIVLGLIASRRRSTHTVEERRVS